MVEVEAALGTEGADGFRGPSRHRQSVVSGGTAGDIQPHASRDDRGAARIHSASLTRRDEPPPLLPHCPNRSAAPRKIIPACRFLLTNRRKFHTRTAMFGLSQTAGYAIRALSCLESARCADKSIGGVAACSGIPRPYLSKIARRLSAAGVLVSRRGRRGGLALARPPAQISLLEVAEVFERENLFHGCLLGHGRCAEDPDCPMHAFWKPARERIREALRACSLADVIRYENLVAARRGVRRRRIRLCQ